MTSPATTLPPRTQPLRAWLVAFLITAVLAGASFVWLDRPIAQYSHGQIADKSIYILMQRLPEILPVGAVVVLVWAGIALLIGRPLQRTSIPLLCSLSYIAAAALNVQLKFIFGRTWPETWVNNNPSLIRDGAFGFNFLHGGAGFASFPSGHTVATCSVLAVLWFAYPRLRLLYGALLAVVVIGLLGADFHFLSDAIAGGFVGGSVGWITVLMARRAAPLTPPTSA